MTTQALPLPLKFVESEIDRQEQRLAALEEQRDDALAQRGEAIAAASAAQDEISRQERLRNGISANEPSPFRRSGIFIEAAEGVARALAAQRGGPWIADVVARDRAYTLTMRLDALGRLIGQVRRELAQLEREEERALHASGQPSRGWAPPALPMLSEPAAGIG